ncbi:MAG: nitrate reductase molybdenum cofactor assembly chaperone [Actinomycetota bacterium]|jgi:nitrate reductase delta subunit|nr:nitrate reductase molybdenum cofactor assembly chaperone [Actinomycetota bacterium]
MRPQATATVFGCASVLLSYPDREFTSDLAAVQEALERLPGTSARSKLRAVVEWLEAMPVVEAAKTYVDVFDLSRGVCLYLTYYRHGDTRERGMALTALVEAFREAGFGIVPGELPDYLPALLELAATSTAGATVLGEHRMALDALHGALVNANSPYADAVAAVQSVLPGRSRTDREALRRYRTDGPPSERVGLEPFAPPEVLGQGVTMGSTRR